MIADRTVMSVASQVKSPHTGSLSCSWPDSSLACAIASTGKDLSLHSLQAQSALEKPKRYVCVSVPTRVVYIFGSPVKEPPTDITPTFLTTGVLSTLRQADFVAHAILRESGKIQSGRIHIFDVFYVSAVC